MMLLALLLAQAAAPGSLSPAEESRDVVVTARRLDDTAKALDDCIARGCPPKEDIDRSLAHAEAQLIAGDYRGSRRTLLSARHRNGRYAAALPVDVSDLHRANSHLADLNGMPESGRIGVFDVVDALKAGLPAGDARIMAARLEVGDAFAKAGRFQVALETYDTVARLARKGRIAVVEGMALFRRATLLSALASVEEGYRPGARKAVAAVMDSADPAWAPFRNGLRLVPAVLAAKKDRAAAITAAATGLEPQPGKPQLLFAPVPDMSSIGFGAARGDDAEWADIGFRIARDGTVEDIDVLRKSDHLPDTWVTAATKSLRERRYAPLLLAPGEPGPVRLERYSFVSDLSVDPQSRSRLRVRSSRRRVDILDLTTQPAPRN